MHAVRVSEITAEQKKRNLRFSAGVSNDAPRMTQLASAKSVALSRSAWPSTVQPGVEAFGYHHNRTQCPRRSARHTS
jgi:hypothetical protein